MEVIIQKVDKLTEEYKFREAYDLVTENKNLFSDPEWYWRVARATFLREHALPKKPTKALLKEMYTEALQFCDEGLKNKPACPDLLTWKGLCIDCIADVSGVHERIQKSYEMRDCWEKAISISPDDKITLTCLGVWCFTVADLPDIKRKFANTFFSKPPTSTYEEALKYLTKALDDNTHVATAALISTARCYHQLKNKTKCREYCDRVMQLPDSGYEVAEAKSDARHLLKHC